MKKITIIMNGWLMMTLLISGTPVLAADMDHSKMGHSKMNHSNMIHNTSLASTAKAQEEAALQKLAVMPTSGKAREGGYDGRYVMESTDVSTALSTRCAQASRGLVMMNNAEWLRCGGRPDGAAQASLSVTDKTKPANEHAGHNM